MRDRKQIEGGRFCGRPRVMVLAAFSMLAFCSLLVLRIASAESRLSTSEAKGSESMVSVLAAPQATPTPSLIQFSQATYQVAEGTV